jgi:hypothetical protein
MCAVPSYPLPSSLFGLVTQISRTNNFHATYISSRLEGGGVGGGILPSLKGLSHKLHTLSSFSKVFAPKFHGRGVYCSF